MDWTRGRTIGHGSSAVVSLATSLSGDNVFAAKSAELSESEFLQREQQILSSLNSPHIITYKGCDITSEDNKLMYNIFMEYATGGTLTDAIRQHGGPLEEPMIVYYTRHMLQGLEYLHSKGFVHCDIKGRNILITGSGAKIGDFGCAKWQSEEVSTGGTPMFMAPEVARGEHQGFASDIWATGCTIIEMASGGAPWSNVTDPVTVLYRIAYSSELPELPGCLSNQAKDFLSKCLKRDPKERWTASQLLNHPFLEEFNSCTKPIVQESNSTSNSPTSILDQDIWDSVEETERSLGNLIRSRSRINRLGERIQRLSCTDGPSWTWDDSWITVRGYNIISPTILDEIEGKDDLICGSVLDFTGEKLLLDFSQSNIGISNGRVRNGNFCGLCTDNKNFNVVIRQRLLPPLISTSSIS